MGIIAVTIAGVMLGVMATAVLPHLSWRRRRSRLAARPRRSFDGWYAEFYREEHPDKELTRDLHGVIGGEVGVDATQIYPSDRFDVELRCPEW